MPRPWFELEVVDTYNDRRGFKCTVVGKKQAILAARMMSARQRDGHDIHVKVWGPAYRPTLFLNSCSYFLAALPGWSYNGRHDVWNYEHQKEPLQPCLSRRKKTNVVSSIQTT